MQKKIDMHAHIFPEKIAEKASASIGGFYDIPMCMDGTLGTLLRTGAAHGLVHYVVQSVATRADQVLGINDYIARAVEAHPGLLTGFGTLHPEMDDPGAEVERVMALGLKGIKLHPDFQAFQADSPKAMRIYEAVEGRLPLLIHAGDPRYDYSSPRRLAAVLDAFPSLTMIAAHLGGWEEWEEAAAYLMPRKLYVDSSSSLYHFTPEAGAARIRAWGIDRVLFGTDYPMWDYEHELERVAKLGLTPEEEDKLFYRNAARLLGLDWAD